MQHAEKMKLQGAEESSFTAKAVLPWQPKRCDISRLLKDCVLVNFLVYTGRLFVGIVRDASSGPNGRRSKDADKAFTKQKEGAERLEICLVTLVIVLLGSAEVLSHACAIRHVQVFVANSSFVFIWK